MSKVIIGNIDLNRLHLEKLPDLSDVEVKGSFNCSINRLTSLEGAPKSVGGNFRCDNNLLTSLKGAPKSIRGYFYCTSNLLTSLEGAPKSVGGDFYFTDNTTKFTEEQVRAVCKVKGEVYV